MKSLLVLVLMCPSSPAADARARFMQTDEWMIVSSLLSIQMTRVFFEARQDREMETSDLTDLGQSLAQLNLLAQRPCRRNEAWCRDAIGAHVIELVREAASRVPARDAKHLARQERLWDGILKQVEDEALRENTTQVIKDYRASTQGRLLAFGQAIAFVGAATAATGVVANYLGLDPDTMWTAAGLAFFGSGAIVTWFRKWLPMARGLRPRANLVEGTRECGRDLSFSV